MRRIKSFLFPHEGNGYKPGIFTRDAVIVIAAVLLFAQIAWFAASTFVFKSQDFLGAVLPGALTTLANADRTANGVGSLAENPLLDKAAQEKADDMAAKGYFSHVAPDGTEPWHWFDLVGYRYTYAGENLAVDFSDSQDVERAWMNSPAHRANIVKPQYTEVGIGVADGTYQGHPATFVVQFFGSPASVPQSVTPAGKPAAPAAAAPSPAIGVASAPAIATPAPEVLGETSAPAPVPQVSASEGRLAKVLNEFAASPNRTLLYVAGGVFAFIALLFLTAIFVNFRIQFFEVLVGGMVLLAAAGGSFLAVEAGMNKVQLPADSQAASVYIGLTLGR